VATGFKAVIVTDLEGVACVTDPLVWDAAAAPEAFAEYVRLFVGEVNAAANACFDSGAEEVLVVEGHRNSFRGQLEAFDPRVRLALGVPFHADAEGAVLSHSHSTKTYVATWLNGTLIGEIGHLGALFGEYGTPLVFVSGDTAACREAEDLVEGIVTASVKQAAGRFGAYSLSPESARSLIREKAAEALSKRDAISPVIVAPPVEFVVEFSTTDPVERDTLIPGIEAAGSRRIVIRGQSVAEVMKLFYLAGRVV
jgi:D-amino peptidase